MRGTLACDYQALLCLRLFCLQLHVFVKDVGRAFASDDYRTQLRGGAKNQRPSFGRPFNQDYCRLMPMLGLLFGNPHMSSDMLLRIA